MVMTRSSSSKLKLLSLFGLLRTSFGSNIVSNKMDFMLHQLRQAQDGVLPFEEGKNGGIDSEIMEEEGTPTFVSTPLGTLEGVLNSKNNQRRFLGVPYAEPPIGELRWQQPKPKSSWDGTLNATRFGNSCVQSRNAFVLGTTLSEDCLYLNVFAPSEDKSENLPVLIYIHGGSWDTGTAAFPIYWGEHMVRDSDEKVILVTINYRLNIFGFMGGEVMRDDEGTTGNWGLQDQRQAMRWVQDNIAYFGGDPDSVTIFGESAGAGSVANHLTSEKSYAALDGPLFHRAMMESGNPCDPWNSQNMSYAETRLAIVAKSVGCMDENSQDKADEDVLNCMKALTSDQLIAANHNLGAPFFINWSPVEDGVEVTGEPRNLMIDGNFATNVSVLQGTNADEGSFFVSIAYDANEQDYDDYISKYLGPDFGPLVRAQYSPEDYNGTQDGKEPGHGPFWATVRWVGDGFFTCPARQTAARFAQTSGSWQYFFNHTVALLDKIALHILPNYIESIGVFHSSELEFVFDFESVLITDEELALAKQMAGYWTSFAAYADPNTLPSSNINSNRVSTSTTSAADVSTVSAALNWPAYTQADDQLMVLATENGPVTPGPMAHLKQDKCDFWDANPIPSGLVFGETIY